MTSEGGLRLRLDSSGSVRSAFYKGTMVSDRPSSRNDQETTKPSADPVWIHPSERTFDSLRYSIQSFSETERKHIAAAATADPIQEEGFNDEEAFKGSSEHDSMRLSYGSTRSKEPLEENREDHTKTCFGPGLLRRITIDPTDWLCHDLSHDANGVPYFDEDTRWSLARWVRNVLYNPIYPEFTSLQQFSWAVIIGFFMGIYTAVWRGIIEFCVGLVWKDLPERLMGWGIFTDANGYFPIYHYMWIVPCLFGGLLSYIFDSLPTPIPGQNEWIHSLHCGGVQSHETFGLLFVLATAGMASGLSLGPELPLVLTAGMLGSWLGVMCKQSILQARVLNLTAAAAAVGGFFGFPLAGALFVLEIPHRMGLQYFEALSPATIASIISVLTHRLIIGNDVTGYFEYPFLNQSLPSFIFRDAVFYGLFGAALGIGYAKGVLLLKHLVHDLFQFDDHPSSTEEKETHSKPTETAPLLAMPSGLEGTPEPTKRHRVCAPKGPVRAAASGAIAGLLVGVTCMFIPHSLFWGEAQLQTLIDNGRTPLPYFGRGTDATADMLSLSFCTEKHGDNDRADTLSGFSLGCSVAIALSKIWVTGLSLGTGIVGGHFWAPLFVGCAASRFLTDFMEYLGSTLGISGTLSEFPCVALLCIMGSCHVVTCKSGFYVDFLQSKSSLCSTHVFCHLPFLVRAHIAIILILALTIDSFDPNNDTGKGSKVPGDFSAVIPLLSVSVFVALHLSRQTIFYGKQRSRGDITALPEVLCEPGKEGKPLVMEYGGGLHNFNETAFDDNHDNHGNHDSYDDNSSDIVESSSLLSDDSAFRAPRELQTLQEDMAAPFDSKIPPNQQSSQEGIHPQLPSKTRCVEHTSTLVPAVSTAIPQASSIGSSLPPRPPVAASLKRTPPKSLDELLATEPIRKDVSGKPPRHSRHRRTRSAPLPEHVDLLAESSTQTLRPLKQIHSFGQVLHEQPSLLEQARQRAASNYTKTQHMK